MRTKFLIVLLNIHGKNKSQELKRVNPDYVNKYVCKNVKNKSVLLTLCGFILYESEIFTDFARAVNINVFVVLSKSKKEMSYFTKLTSLFLKFMNI